jgi:hypothetical protein
LLQLPLKKFALSMRRDPSRRTGSIRQIGW